MERISCQTLAPWRAWKVAATLAIALIMSAIAVPAKACPDAALSGPPMQVDVGQPAPPALQVSAGGSVSLTGCKLELSGQVSAAPAAQVALSGSAGAQSLTLRVDSGCEAMILVHDGAAGWRTSGAASRSPSLTLPQAADGGYAVWVATSGPARCGATLNAQVSGAVQAAPAQAAPQTAPVPEVAGRSLNGPVLPDPGSLDAYRSRSAQGFNFEVTGASTGVIDGTGVYSIDSPLAVAAVHAGLLHVGQTGVVTARFRRGAARYDGSDQNGILSQSRGANDAAYRFDEPFLMRSQLVNLFADPGTLSNLRGLAGETLVILVTGSAAGMVWGSGPYTDDSTLSRAVVHAGLLEVGQTGTVFVTLAPGAGGYQGSTRNGVQSLDWGGWGGSYQLSLSSP